MSINQITTLLLFVSPLVSVLVLLIIPKLVALNKKTLRISAISLTLFWVVIMIIFRQTMPSRSGVDLSGAFEVFFLLVSVGIIWGMTSGRIANFNKNQK